MLLQYGRGLMLTDPDIARTVLCIFWILAEPVRVAAGWYGNLQENVGDLWGLASGKEHAMQSSIMLTDSEVALCTKHA